VITDARFQKSVAVCSLLLEDANAERGTHLVACPQAKKHINCQWALQENSLQSGNKPRAASHPIRIHSNVINALFCTATSSSTA
jgi:hypothetical protein